MTENKPVLGKHVIGGKVEIKRSADPALGIDPDAADEKGKSAR